MVVSDGRTPKRFFSTERNWIDVGQENRKLLEDFELEKAAVGIVPFQINPHYVEPEPGSRHQGETREQRINEYHLLNHRPVLGLREGAMLRVKGDRMHLIGNGAKLFRRNQKPREYKPRELHFLLRR